MKLYSKNPIILMLLCLMTGIFVTVSFLETPLKFQVPGMTIPIALELGKIMFGISTKIQCIILLIILGLMLFYKSNYSKLNFITIAVLILILILEKLWMLPVLDARADLLSAGKPVSPSELHNYFIYAEVAKAIFLMIAISLQFKSKKINQ